VRAHPEILEHERSFRHCWTRAFGEVALKTFGRSSAISRAMEPRSANVSWTFPRRGWKSGSWPRLDNPQKNWQLSAAEIYRAWSVRRLSEAGETCGPCPK
jgi:hypothetical protein